MCCDTQARVRSLSSELSQMRARAEAAEGAWKQEAERASILERGLSETRDAAAAAHQQALQREAEVRLPMSISFWGGGRGIAKNVFQCRITNKWRNWWVTKDFGIQSKHDFQGVSSPDCRRLLELFLKYARNEGAKDFSGFVGVIRSPK
jgi:hypothetical protein